MKIYRPVIKVGPDHNDVYCRFDVVTKDDRWMLNESFRGEQLPIEDWVPFKVVRSPSTPGNLTKPLGDRAGIDFNTDPMVLSRRALDVLLPHIGAFGQVLPLAFDEADYSLFNITNVVDALEIGACEIVRYPDGGISRIVRHAFNSEALREAWIFTIPQRPGQTFVSERFVKLVQDAKLTGFGFDLLWNDEGQELANAA